MTEPKPTPREAIVLPIVLVVAAAAAIVVKLVVHVTPKEAENAGWLKWGLLVLGIFGIASAVFDRQQKTGRGDGWRVKGLVLLVGPAGARIAFALIGGGFLGGAICLFAG